MLVSIKHVKGLGVFDDFFAAPQIPPHKQFNIFYGENGSGKTTLTRLLATLGTGAHKEHPYLEYSIESQIGHLSQKQPYSRKVLVFNSDYVEANIGQFSRPLDHIHLIIGAENKVLAEEAITDKQLYDEREAAIKEADTNAARLQEERGKVFTTIAKTISEATSGTTSRQYRKPNAQQTFDSTKPFAMLDSSSLDLNRNTLRQERLEAILAPQEDPLQSTVKDVAALPEEISIILKRSSQNQPLVHISNIQLVAAWIEQGFVIHITHDYSDCAFCSQVIPSDRMAGLKGHFNADDQKLKAEIEIHVATARRLINQIHNLTFPDRSAIYSELRPALEEALVLFEATRVKAISQLEAAITLLEEKQSLRAESYSRHIDIDAQNMLNANTAIWDIVAQHNKKTSNFDEAISEARTAIEHHYLATISAQIEDIDDRIQVETETMNRLKNGDANLSDQRSLQELLDSYRTKMAKVSDAHAASELLSDRLATFLGRTDLRFESVDVGYSVLRKDNRATGLSEGEKTAIAFLYFTVQLEDSSNHIEESIVVIDDPISSLDASSIYQAFSFLKKSAESAKQCFILTHNYDFLRLLINWTQNALKSKSSYYMIVCTDNGNSRQADIRPLDPLLLDHPTEYCYLFKVLYHFKSDGTILSSYHIPNMARKVLETFLEFHMPQKRSLHSKLESVDFDKQKKTAIYKFANDLSHLTGKGFDPALVAETQKNVKLLLEMIKAVSPIHYSGMEELAL